MKVSRRLLVAIILAGSAVLTAASGCVFDSFLLPETLETEGIRSESGSILSLSYSPDGRQLASSHQALLPIESRHQSQPLPPEVRLWTSDQPDLEPKRLVAVFAAPRWDWDWPALSFSPDGKQLYAATSRGLLRWDIPGQRLDRFFEGYHVTISPDGQTVARDVHERPRIDALLELDASNTQAEKRPTDQDAARIELLDLANGTVARRINHARELRPGFFASHDEFLACYGDDGQVSIWHIPSESWRCRVPGQALPRGTFSPDGQFFATQAPKEGSIYIWSLQPGWSGGMSGSKELKTGGGVWCLAFSPDGTVLAVGREGGNGRGGEIQLWEVKAARQINKIRDRSTWGITALCFSPDGATLASGSGDGAIKFLPVPDMEK
jgi:WD40 repeat protein